jgi:hypothetical protein
MRIIIFYYNYANTRILLIHKYFFTAFLLLLTVFYNLGLNEYTNKLIRQYIPKKQTFTNYDDEMIKKIQLKINRRPRKKLNSVHRSVFDRDRGVLLYIFDGIISVTTLKWIVSFIY